MTSPHWIVLPRPTPSASSKLDSRHLQGPEDRLQLVWVNLDGRIPYAEERLVLDAIAFSQPVQPRPAVGIDKGLENLGIVCLIFVHAGQSGLAQHHPRGLDFPKELLGLGIAEVIEVFDIDDVQSALDRAAVVGFDRPHRGESVADSHGLTDFGDWGWGVFHYVLFLPMLNYPYAPLDLRNRRKQDAPPLVETSGIVGCSGTAILSCPTVISTAHFHRYALAPRFPDGFVPVFGWTAPPTGSLGGPATRKFGENSILPLRTPDRNKPNVSVP